MKKTTILLAILFGLLFSFNTADKATDQSYKGNEFLKYKVKYNLFGADLIYAGDATLSVKEKNLNGKPHYYCVGEGSSQGAVETFFSVKDKYETYIDKSTNKPSKFIRKINEGGYTKDKVLTFSHDKSRVKVNNRKNKKIDVYKFSGDVQDMLSAFYYLRGKDIENMKKGASISLNIFMDEESFKFKMKSLGNETIKTKYGNVECVKLRPYVQAGRVFKAEESVTMYITKDKNQIPVLIEAELAVGKLTAELSQYKNLKYTSILK